MSTRRLLAVARQSLRSGKAQRTRTLLQLRCLRSRLHRCRAKPDRPRGFARYGVHGAGITFTARTNGVLGQCTCPPATARHGERQAGSAPRDGHPGASLSRPLARSVRIRARQRSACARRAPRRHPLCYLRAAAGPHAAVARGDCPSVSFQSRGAAPAAGHPDVPALQGEHPGAWMLVGEHGSVVDVSLLRVSAPRNPDDAPVVGQVQVCLELNTPARGLPF